MKNPYQKAFVMGGLVFGPKVVNGRMIHNLDLGTLIVNMYQLRQD
jgi:hypothetical protein